MSLFLFDTHVVVWALNEPRRLTPEVLALLKRDEHRLLISVASFWETAIKMAVHKMRAPDDFPAAAEALGLTILPITPDHAWAVRRLPPLHGDPFDRLLVAQAFAEDAVLVTHDAKMHLYGCNVLMT